MEDESNSTMSSLFLYHTEVLDCGISRKKGVDDQLDGLNFKCIEESRLGVVSRVEPIENATCVQELAGSLFHEAGSVSVCSTPKLSRATAAI